MSAKRPFGVVDALLLLLVLATAGGARVAYLVGPAEGGQSAGPVLVQDDSRYDFSEHGWFGTRAPLSMKKEDTAHVAPGYPWLLSSLSDLLGPDDLASTMRWIQCGLGALTAGVYFLFARRAFESRLVALLAGLLTGLHPFWVVNTAALNDGTLVAFLLGLLLWLGSAAGQSGGVFAGLLYGFTAAGLALTRAALLPFAFVAVLWLLWRTRRLERGWMCALAVFLGFSNGLLPWTIRNVLTFKEPVPLVTSAYYHLWMGNHPGATGGPRDEAELLNALAADRGTYASVVRDELADVPQPERYRRLAIPLVKEVQQHPAETVQRRFAAARSFLVSESMVRQQTVASFRATPEEPLPEWVKSVAEPALLLSLGAMLLLALLAWRWTYPWRERSMTASLALVWVPLPYVVGHAGHLHGPRLPLDGILLTYSAYVLACLWPATARLLFQGPPPEDSEPAKPGP